MTRIGILGVAGRMGQAILSEVLERDGATFAGGCDSLDHPRVGEPLRHPHTGEDLGLSIGSEPAEIFSVADVVIDFTSPSALENHLVLSAATQTPLIVGTTGLTQAHSTLIDEVGTQVPIMQAANTSLGVTLLAQLVKQAAALLGPDWDIEVNEIHHRGKVDAPSGTALLLGHKAAEGRNTDESAFVTARTPDTGAREEGSIGFSVMRGGDVAGEHTVMFAADAERIELTHKASDRKIFARGAVTAAQWIIGLPAGRYTMEDVVGL